MKIGVNSEDVRQFVITLFPPGKCFPSSQDTLLKIFEAITSNGLWDCLHYSPLVQIVQTFGANDTEMEGWVQSYENDLKAYSIVTTVEDYIEADLDVADASMAECAKYDSRYYCPMEWKTEFIDHTLQYLADVWKLFSGRYLVPKSPPTALLHRVQEGCVSVTWLIPLDLILTLINRIKVDTDFLEKYHILRVTVGNRCVYEVSHETKHVVKFSLGLETT